MKKDLKIGVIGGGSWATALVKLLTNNVDSLNWWMRNETAIEHIKQYSHNPNYLSSAQLDITKLNVSSDLELVIQNSDVLVLATPSAFIYDLFKDKTFEGLENKIMFSAVKGIIPEYHAIPARYIHKQFGIPYNRIGIISGPCHAEEIALERLSYLTIACPEEAIAQDFASVLNCRYLNTITSDDLFGTEFSAILKNIYAIASGICHGLGYGDNFQAVLISNAIREIETFIDKVHPIHRNVNSSAYLGDLLVTAYSQFSRNRTFGNMIGKGYSVKAAQMEMNMVAEGYYAVKSVIEVNKKFDVEMPIVESVYRIIYEKIAPSIEIGLLTKQLS